MYGIYGYPTVGYGYGTPSPIMGGSPASSSEGMASCITTPPFMPLVPIGMFPPYVMDVNGQPRPMFASSPPCQKCGHHNNIPTVPRHTCDTEDPLDNSKSNCNCKGKKGKKTTVNKKQKTPKCPRKLKFNQGSSVLSSNPPKKRGRPPKTASTAHESYAAIEDSDSEGEYFSPLTTKRKKPEAYDREMPSKGLAQTISDMSLNYDMKNSRNRPSVVTQTISNKAFKSVPVLECISRQNSSVNESKHIENGGRIPALNSLLDMGDASIMGITKAMKNGP